MRRQPIRNGEQRVLLVLQQTSELSLEEIALSTNYARCTVQRIIKRLIYRQRLLVYSGSGRRPNRYEII
jgi:DNA-binding MarR family transcriptional regulator